MTVPPDDRSREDELFRQIVAGYAVESTDPVPPWPVDEDTDHDVVDSRTEPDRSEPDRSEPVRDDRPAPAAPAQAGLPDWVEPTALPDEGHYVPPEPPRLPRPRLRTAAGVAILLLGLVGLLAPFKVGLDDSTASLLLAMIVTGTGLWVLVTSLNETRDDGPDDGAVV